ncbi:DUF3304 domain-containing protein [Lysobacter cavernae]|uniref:DUF3304 domain-containing protein n=1 Tax=Lysobacter cavernae TaxID=1685901 RepID=A0ABV7RT59_9GAMM
MSGRWIAAVALMVGLMFLGGCAAMAKGGEKGGKLVSEGVSLFAFNYTGRYIGDIRVNGMWLGGAGAHSNSGSAAGLLAPRDRSKRHSVKVTWVVADVYDISTNKYQRRPDEPHEAMVELAFPYPEHPSELILHFFPDGHVEAELIQGMANVWKARRIQPPEGYKR